MPAPRVPHRDEPVDDGSRSARDEIERIVRSATIWTATAAVVPAIGYGPLFASGWRPAALPPGLAIAWWASVVVAALGLGLLVWAGCPAIGTSLRKAYEQKMQSVRFGIVLSIVGLAVGGLAVALSPAMR